MPLYIDGTIKLIAPKTIKAKSAGEADFTYYENYIQYKDKKGLDQVLTVNSVTDFRDRKDLMGVATLTAYNTKAMVEQKTTRELRSTSLYKLSLSEFTPQD